MEERPIVLVHPYFKFAGLTDGYKKEIQKLVSTTDRPLIVLEEVDWVPSTREKFESYGRNDARFIPTYHGNPEPIEGWDKFFEHLNMFRGRPVSLVGGYYNLYGHGCLNKIEAKLKAEDIESEVLAGLVF